MNAFKVRRVDPLAHARTQAVQRWRRAGQGVGSGRLQKLSGYLRFCAQGDAGNWRGLILAREWLHHSLPQLQSLLVVECPLASIAGLFRVVPRPLRLEVDELHYRELSDVELVDATHLPSHDLPWLDTPGGRVWLTQLPAPRPSSPPLAWRSWLNDLPLRLDLLLGISYLSRLRLGAGDVLRITQRTQHGVLANRRIGVFTFTEEGLHMQSTVADATQHAAEPEADVELDSLPVRLDFVLATHEIDLATLSAFIEGQLIPLAVDAARRIEVRANGKCVARGELVQLDEQLGVELLEVYRNPRDE